MSSVDIDTTQNVAIRFQTASVLERILARIIDAVIIVVFVYAALIPIALSFGSDSSDYSVPLTLLILAFAVGVFYPFMMESIFHGQTVGKMALSIRVIREDGTEPTVGNYAIRFLISIVESTFMFGIIALVTILVSKNHQRLGDMAASTLVIRKPKKVSLEQLELIADAPDHVIKYHGARNLSPADIEVVREVLLEVKKPALSIESAFQLLYATMERIETVIDEHAPEGTAPAIFLHDVLADYNAIHGTSN